MASHGIIWLAIGILTLLWISNDDPQQQDNTALSRDKRKAQRANHIPRRYKTTKINPFTRTPGVAGAAFIDMHYADEIIVIFESELSSKYVYKIVGLRGSGKSVVYSKVINTLSKKKDWLVYTLSVAGDSVTTLIARSHLLIAKYIPHRYLPADLLKQVSA